MEPALPHASHRIDLILVSEDPDRALNAAAFDALCARWEDAGALRGEAPGPDVDALLPGGFRRLWRDAPGGVAFYANQQGGFRVRCPRTRAFVARNFAMAVEAWRAGAPRKMRCPECGQRHALETMVLEPPGAFGWGAVIFADAGSLDLTPSARDALVDALGPLREVARRTA